MCVMPLTGITGMMKKMVMKRIPLFRTNWATVPHCPQCIRCSVRIDPQTKKWSPMMSIVFTCAESVPRAWLRTMARPGGPRSLPLAVLIQLLRLFPGGLLTGADEFFRVDLHLDHVPEILPYRRRSEQLAIKLLTVPAPVGVEVNRGGSFGFVVFLVRPVITRRPFIPRRRNCPARGGGR